MALISNKLLSHGMGSWGQVPNQHQHAAPAFEKNAVSREGLNPVRRHRASNCLRNTPQMEHEP